MKTVKVAALTGALAMAWTMGAAAADNIPVTGRTVTRILTYETYAQIRFTPSFANSEGCDNTAQDRIVVDWDPAASRQDRKAMLATAMLALATGANVGFGISGCHRTGVPSAYRVDLNAP